MVQLGFHFDTLREEVAAIGRLVPRDYQVQAIDTAFELWHGGAAGVMVRQPTGTGKTIVGTMISDRWLSKGKDRRVLVIAHERQLIHQFADEIRDVLGKYPGIEMASEKIRGTPPITVASRQTLISESDGVSRLEKFDPRKYKWLVILDEVHRWAFKLKSCRPILDWFAVNPESKRLGLTATPERGDKTSLAKVVPEVAADYRLYDLDGGPCAVADGWAVAYDQRFVTAEGVDFKNLRTLKSTGDFDPAELETILGEESMLRKLVQPTLELVGDRRTIIFSATTGMAKAVAQCINSFKPDQAVELDGQHGEYHRADVYRRHQGGAFQFLSVCGLCREGYNDPGIGAVAVFRPTKSRPLAEQMKGRGCRPLRGCVNSQMSKDARLAAIAASAKPDCIAEGTPILTDHGLVPIEQVTRAMRVWDGVDFVTHCGIISRGYQRVITYAGLTATPDHEVMIHDETNSESKTETWASLGDCAAEQTAIRVTEIGGKAILEADGRIRRDRSSGEWRSESTARLDGMRLRTSLAEGLLLADKRQGGLQEVREQNGNTAVAFEEGQRCKGSVCESKQRGLRPIRWARDQVQVFDDAGNGPLGDGDSGTPQGIGVGQDQQRRPLRGGKPPIRDGFIQSVEYQKAAYQRGVSLISDCPPRNSLFGRHTQAIAEAGSILGGYSGPPRQKRHTSTRAVQGTARVFDILNAGPRHRFTASGLLVSNCMIVDLVGITGMADCASTAHCLGSGLPDEVIDRANRNALKKTGKVDIGDELRKARKQVADEERERRRAEREAREQREREEAARRAKIESSVAYRAVQVQQGTGMRVHHANGKARGARMIFGKHKGELIADINSGYLRWMTESDIFEGKTQWLKDAAHRELDRRQAARQPAPIIRGKSIDEINAELAMCGR